MYNGIKSVIELNGNMSDIFLCNVGVGQGKNVSPILFISAIKLLFEHARKAMYSIIFKARSTGMPIDIQFKLLDLLVLSIMTYGCEHWGHENLSLLEKLHLKF